MTRDISKKPQSQVLAERRTNEDTDPALVPHSALDEVRDSAAARLTILVCAALVAFGLIWAAEARVEEKVTGVGTIETQGQIERIEHPDGGVVLNLLAEDNSILPKGALLLSFDTSQIEREAKTLTVRIESLEHESERVRYLLDADGTALPTDRPLGDAGAAAFWAEQVFLVAQLERIQAEDTRLLAQVESASFRVDILKEEQQIVAEQLVRYERFVDSGTVRLLDRESLQRELLQINSDMEEVNGRRLELLSAREENARRRTELLAQRRRDAAVRWTKIEEELASYRQAAADAAKRIERAHVHTATGGQVQRLEVLRAKEVVAPGDLIAEIVPPGVAYRAVVDVSADRIGSITQGMEVTLKIVSYDFTRFGAITAEVSEVSPTSFVNDQGEVVFRVTVNLPPSEPASRSAMAIRSGMTVTADILTGERTILSYLLRPVLKLKDQSLSET